ncbi:HlyD family efflux transporter periplasmic adaptor subunit [Pseudomonas aeruginosa]
MKKQLIAGAAVLLAIERGELVFPWRGRQRGCPETVRHNVDIRQVSGVREQRTDRCAACGGRRQGARRAGSGRELDTRTLRLRIETARARIGVQEQVLLRLRNGTRPQEVDQSRARLQAAQAEAELARLELVRLQRIAGGTDGKGVSRQSLDAAAARPEGRQGRSGEPAQGLAARRHRPAGRGHRPGAGRTGGRPGRPEASRALSSAGAIEGTSRRDRPDALAGTGRHGFAEQAGVALALTDPKWVRAYVNERQLGRVHPGQKARVVTDSVPERPVDGRVGYISSVAEFTPKTVETEGPEDQPGL